MTLEQIEDVAKKLDAYNADDEFLPPADAQFAAQREDRHEALHQWFVSPRGVTKSREHKRLKERNSEIMDPQTYKKAIGDFKLSIWNYIVIGFKGVFGDGFVSIVEYLLQLFNERVLGKCDPETLRKWSQVFEALADFIERMLAIFMSQGAVCDASKATINAVRDLAQHLSDGKYVSDELESDIEAVRIAVKAWRNARSR